MAPKKDKKAGGKDGEIAATVEESNKMRAALGIKPLDEKGSKTKEVSAPAPGRGDKDKAAEPDVKKKTSAAKTRRDHEELVSGPGIADIIATEEGTGGAADWIARTRGKDGAMKGAAASAAASSADDKGKKRKAADVAEVPKGTKVRHDASQLEQGETIVTLADKPILNKVGDKWELNDNEPDELSNVRMNDSDRAKHNEEVKNQKEYDATKDSQDILEKYNELKTGPAGFIVGGTTMGVISEQDPEKRLAILTALNDKQTLESAHKVQTDFYTAEEMQKFRKPPKKKTKRRQQKDAKDKEDQIASANSGGPMVLPGRPADAGSDEEDPELYEQLSKQRRLVRRSDAGAVRKGEAALTAVSERIALIPEEEVSKDKEKEPVPLGTKGKEGEMISLTATTEFCNVVQTPLEKMETMKHESFRGSTLYKQQATQRKGLKADSRKEKRGALSEEELAALAGKEEEEDTGLVGESLDLSCASGLAYLRARSQIGGDQDSHKFRKLDNRPLEMSTVDGDIKLEYRDDFGRVQTPKEAFRAISWKFHGKTPGRKNMERRLLRLENEMRLKGMDPINQLPTIKALSYVQHADAKPYMVLSGANEK